MCDVCSVHSAGDGAAEKGWLYRGSRPLRELRASIETTLTLCEMWQFWVAIGGCSHSAALTFSHLKVSATFALISVACAK